MYFHFYPRPPWGGRLAILIGCANSAKFLSTPSVGRATDKHHIFGGPYRKFLSTPSVGRATGERRRSRRPVYISIHALRGEGDSKCDGRTHRICGKVPKWPEPPWHFVSGQRTALAEFPKERRKRRRFMGADWCEGPGEGLGASLSHGVFTPAARRLVRGKGRSPHAPPCFYNCYLTGKSADCLFLD